ncbi:dockerin type I repeat-containing protein [Ruminococcus albus]|uniref:dockerin type I repeat-containing protein n=1 Tax=Ruminococcus albus TaxID=1264 RepID=UPI000462F90F|nr:dockerin type I repeat-containing protein [Ruminococcus albus]
MKKKSIASFLTALAVGANTAVWVSAEKKTEYNVRTALVSSDLSLQSWDETSVSEGQNTITFTTPKDGKGDYTTIKGISLFVIDLEDSYFDIGAVKVDSIVVDGKPLDFKADSIIYGADDGTDNNDFRIELFNSFGETKNDPPFDASSVTVNEKIEVTFTFSTDGYSGGTRRIGGNIIEKKKSSKPQPINGCSVSLNRNKDDGRSSHDDEISCTVSGSEFYADVERGFYDVTISKSGYVTRTVRNVPAGKDMPEELKDIDLRVYGDVNGDGKINVTDLSLVAAYVKKLRMFSDDYQFNVADVSHDDKVNISDITKIAAAVKGLKKIK